MLTDEIGRLIPEHQFILTTHSPYFLDLLELEHIITTERKDGLTKYYRPADNENLLKWKEKFSIGKLYTMNKLTEND